MSPETDHDEMYEDDGKRSRSGQDLSLFNFDFMGPDFSIFVVVVISGLIAGYMLGKQYDPEGLGIETLLKNYFGL